MIPADLADFRQEHCCVFDMESTERKADLNTTIEINAVQKVVCIGVSSSLPIQSKYFVRKSSAPIHSTELVTAFVDFLFEAEVVYHATIPEDILDAVPEEDEEYSENVCEKIKVERQLRKYSAMPVYGYNSGKLCIFYMAHIIQ